MKHKQSKMFLQTTGKCLYYLTIRRFLLFFILSFFLLSPQHALANFTPQLLLNAEKKLAKIGNFQATKITAISQEEGFYSALLTHPHTLQNPRHFLETLINHGSSTKNRKLLFHALLASILIGESPERVKNRLKTIAPLHKEEIRLLYSTFKTDDQLRTADDIRKWCGISNLPSSLLNFCQLRDEFGSDNQQFVSKLQILYQKNSQEILLRDLLLFSSSSPSTSDITSFILENYQNHLLVLDLIHLFHNHQQKESLITLFTVLDPKKELLPHQDFFLVSTNPSIENYNELTLAFVKNYQKLIDSPWLDRSSLFQLLDFIVNSPQTAVPHTTIVNILKKEYFRSADPFAKARLLLFLKNYEANSTDFFASIKTPANVVLLLSREINQGSFSSTDEILLALTQQLWSSQKNVTQLSIPEGASQLLLNFFYMTKHHINKEFTEAQTKADWILRYGDNLQEYLLSEENQITSIHPLVLLTTAYIIRNNWEGARRIALEYFSHHLIAPATRSKETATREFAFLQQYLPVSEAIESLEPNSFQAIQRNYLLGIKEIFNNNWRSGRRFIHLALQKDQQLFIFRHLLTKSSLSWD